MLVFEKVTAYVSHIILVLNPTKYYANTWPQ